MFRQLCTHIHIHFIAIRNNTKSISLSEAFRWINRIGVELLEERTIPIVLSQFSKRVLCIVMCHTSNTLRGAQKYAFSGSLLSRSDQIAIHSIRFWHKHILIFILCEWNGTLSKARNIHTHTPVWNSMPPNTQQLDRLRIPTGPLSGYLYYIFWMELIIIRDNSYMVIYVLCSLCCSKHVLMYGCVCVFVCGLKIRTNCMEKAWSWHEFDFEQQLFIHAYLRFLK